MTELYSNVALNIQICTSNEEKCSCLLQDFGKWLEGAYAVNFPGLSSNITGTHKNVTGYIASLARLQLVLLAMHVPCSNVSMWNQVLL